MVVGARDKMSWRFPRKPSMRTGAFLAAVAAGTTIVFVIGCTVGRGYGRRLLQTLWDGDREARAKARQLGVRPNTVENIFRTKSCFNTNTFIEMGTKFSKTVTGNILIFVCKKHEVSV